MTEGEIVMIDDMMTRDDKKIENFKIAQIVHTRLNMISKGILHHLAKFQISWPVAEFYGHFREFPKRTFWKKDIRTVRTTFKMVILQVKMVC